MEKKKMSNKELESLLKLLRKHGVKSFKTATIELELGDLPIQWNKIENLEADLPEALKPKQEENPFANLTEEDILNWSSSGT